MSQHYNVYVFTAGTLDYAEPIINYLNTPKKTILGFLHRKNCMETQNGFFIKDLRIIQNRTLKDIVMVDNLVHSFGLQITNGVPILEFLNNKHDRELQGMEKLLVEASTKEDVREFFEEKLRLKSVLEINENEYLAVDELAVQKI
jgi:CTD small phosphatase-like protein 2